MIRHDDVARYTCAIIFEMGEPSIYRMIGVSFENKVEPLVTSNCTEINSFSLMLNMRRQFVRKFS
jgi:hypothetical protein